MTPIQALQDLIHLDMDAINAYQKAIDACEHESVASSYATSRATTAATCRTSSASSPSWARRLTSART